MRRVLLVAVAVSVACTGLGGCASSTRRTSEPPGAESFAPRGDSRLIGTWKVAEALDGSQTIHADGATYEYLVFKGSGDMTRYEGESTEAWTWSAKHGQLVLQPAGAGSSSGYAEVSAISGTVDKLESSDGIAYQITGNELTLSGTFRDYRAVLLHPSEIPTSPAPATPVRVSYIRVNGLPPPPQIGQPPTAQPSPTTTRQARP